MWRRIGLTLILISSISGCTLAEGLGAIKTLTGENGMHNELHVGDRENQVGDDAISSVGKVNVKGDGQVTIDQRKEEAKVKQAEHVIINEMDKPTLWLLLAVAFVFLLLPTPASIYKELKAFFKWLFT